VVVGGGSRLAVVVTVAKGYDLGYIWKTQGDAAGRATGGYYINAAQAGEPPGRWRAAQPHGREYLATGTGQTAGCRACHCAAVGVAAAGADLADRQPLTASRARAPRG